MKKNIPERENKYLKLEAGAENMSLALCQNTDDNNNNNNNQAQMNEAAEGGDVTIYR